MTFQIFHNVVFIPDGNFCQILWKRKRKWYDFWTNPYVSYEMMDSKLSYVPDTLKIEGVGIFSYNNGELKKTYKWNGETFIKCESFKK